MEADRLACTLALCGAFTLKRLQDLIGRDVLAEVIQRLPHGPEITWRQIRNAAQPHPFDGGQFLDANRTEHSAIENQFPRLRQRVELEFECESTQCGSIQIRLEIGRPDEYAIEVFHPVQQLVDLCDLPTAGSPLA